MYNSILNKKNNTNTYTTNYNNNNNNTSNINNQSLNLTYIIDNFLSKTLKIDITDILHSINISCIVLLLTLISIYYINDHKNKNIDRTTLILILLLILLTHHFTDILAKIEDKRNIGINDKEILRETIIILFIEIFISLIMLLPLILISNFKLAIYSTYILAFLILLFNNIFILKADIINTFIFFTITILGGLFIILFTSIIKPYLKNNLPLQ